MKETVLKVSFTYDPEKDLAPVDQFGFIDLRDAYVNNTIPGDLVTSDVDYNGVEDPSSLMGKSSDVFEAYRKAQYVKSAESAAKSNGVAASSSSADTE